MVKELKPVTKLCFVDCRKNGPECECRQNFNTSWSTDFDIEDLDPDKRSWYYDGDGTKRKKE